MTTLGKVVVVGTANLDLSLKTHHLPVSGETVMGDLSQSGGGKAANQAVAAARLGADVHFITRFGDDANGEVLRDLLEADGVNLDASQVIEGGATGVAIIYVDEQGGTMIGVAEGVNRFMEPADLDRCPELQSSDTTVLAEFGVPMSIIERLCELRRDVGFTLVLNPAPYVTPLADWCWPLIDVLIPNEVEASDITGIEVTDEATALQAARKIRDMGVSQVLVTMGEDGVVFANEDVSGRMPAFKVEAVDTTGASDSFNGAITVEVKKGTMREAARYAAAAAALSVTKPGAMTSLPTRAEVDAFIETQGGNRHA